MANENARFMDDVPDFVKEAEAAMAAGEFNIPEPPQEVTIKFGKGLVGEPFTSKSGKELVEVMIPNVDPADKRAWETFVVPSNMVHDNKFGKGVWMKLPEAGTTRLSRSIRTGVGEDGKPIWGRETREVSNTELKSLLEAYKERDSVLGKLAEKKDVVAAAPKAPKKSATKSHEEVL